MINQLPELEEEDRRYDLHVGAEAPETYNLTLVFPNWTPHWAVIPQVPVQSPDQIKNNLAKIGIFFN
jgi:hypothetical protein